MRLLIILIFLPLTSLLGQKLKTVKASSGFVMVNTKPTEKPRINYFKADKDTVLERGEIKLLWSVANAQKIQLEAYDKNNKLIATESIQKSEGEIKKSINEETTFKLVADEINISKKITTKAPVTQVLSIESELSTNKQAIIISFKADKTEINKGESVTISWSVLNKTNVVIFVGDTIEEIIPVTENGKVKLYPNKHELKISPKKTQYYVLKADEVSQYIKIEVGSG